MPKVVVKGKVKHYPYTKKGKATAKKATAKDKANGKQNPSSWRRFTMGRIK